MTSVYKIETGLRTGSKDEDLTGSKTVSPGISQASSYKSVQSTSNGQVNVIAFPLNPIALRSLQ